MELPLAFWDGGRTYMVSNGPVPLTSAVDPGNPLQANAAWSYNPLLTSNLLQNIGPGLSFVVAPSGNGNTLYGADWADPTTTYQNKAGVVMWYHETAVIQGQAAAPHIFGPGIPAVLTEATFRDPKQPAVAPNMPPSQIFLIDNYDVSYVDSLAFAASMEATQVPSSPPTPGPSQFAWLGSDLSTTQIQQLIAGFTTNNPSVNTVSGSNLNGLGTYFGGLGWDQFYLPPDINSTATDAIQQINNPNPNNKPDTPVTIISKNSVAALVNGEAVTISGVTTGQIAINDTWIISNVNVAGNSFALTGIAGTGVASSGANMKWTASPTTGIDLQKLPAGYDTISQSANVNSPSLFDSTKYNLLSGGAVAQVTTVGTGEVLNVGDTTIQNVNTALARQMVPGMLLAAGQFPAGSSTLLFPLGTIISTIQIGTGASDSTITMSNPATAKGSPGNTGAGGSWSFFGSQFSTANSQSSLQGKIAPSASEISNLDPNVAMYLRPGMLVTGGGIQTGSQTYIKSISTDFTTVTLTQSGTAVGGAGPYAFVGAPDSYVAQALINNWYAWADYYVNQLGSGPAAAPGGAFPASTLAIPAGVAPPAPGTPRTDKNALTLQITDAAFDMNQLRVGGVVTSAGATLNKNATGSPGTPGYDPSLNYTIVNFDPKNRTVEVSLPVAVNGVVPDTYTFVRPQYIVRSNDAPLVILGPSTSISSISNTNGQPITIFTSNTSGLVNGSRVTINGLTSGQTAINGTWTISNVVANTSFQLPAGIGGIMGNGQTAAGTMIWYLSAGTSPYTLDFSVPTNSIAGISSTQGQPITITTASTLGLSEGQQITISGVVGPGTLINGAWTIAKLTATTFQLVSLGKTNDGTVVSPLGNGSGYTSRGNWSPANALQFAQTVYDVMQTMSLLVDPTTLASRSASLLGYIIGGNTGTFVINEDFFNKTGRHTILPDYRTAHDLRDEIKSVLRGVYNFNAVPDQSQWYPNPATATPNATLNGAAIKFGIYNLDPYVWFVHDVLHNSSYGFSFDDDVANAQAASSTLQIAVGGNAYTAANPPTPYNNLSNPEGFAPWAQWGTQQSQGYIDTTSPAAIENAKTGQVTISGLSQATVARLSASDPKKDHPGAYITSDSTGLLPAGATIVNIRASAAVTDRAITSITNPSGTTIRINTADTGTLGIGDLVSISGVTGDSAINDRWLVTNVIKNTSFDLQGVKAIYKGPYGGAGAWTWEPSFVTFLKPTNPPYNPPTDNAKHQFTFSAFLGTVVPTNITAGAPQAAPGAEVAILGKGLTGVYGVSFNGYPAKIVGSDITSITNAIGKPIIIGAADTTGLNAGDTVTIRDVIDDSTGQQAAISGGLFQAVNIVPSTSTKPGSFELKNSTGDGHALSRGNWIDGSDTLVTVIVPSFQTNSNGTTYPGPTGKIGVRNQSGTNYSDANFTISTPNLTQSTALTIADFKNYGLHEFNGVNWTRLTPADPSLAVIDALGDVVADFPGYGLIRYTPQTNWQPLNTGDADLLVGNSAGDIAFNVPGSGLYRYSPATGVEKLTSATANLLSIAPDGRILANFFQLGVYLAPVGGNLQSFGTGDASQLVFLNNGQIAGSFPGYGVWIYVGSPSWTKLSSMDAQFLASDSQSGEFAAEFTGSGVYLYANSVSGLQRITPSDAGQLAFDSKGNLFGDFSNYGVFQYIGLANWQPLNSPPANPDLLQIEPDDGLIVDFVDDGVWSFTSSKGWTQFTAFNPTFIGSNQ